jgi:hypothetical protein
VSKQPHDEAVNRVGLLLFEEAWINELTQAEIDHGKTYADRAGSFERIVRGKPFPHEANDAIAAARAATRYQTWAAQFEQVRRWLFSQGIDCSSAKEFNSDKFEKWFAEKFGRYENTATAKRVASVRKLLQTMNPGRGGTQRWVVFCDAVRKDCRQRCDDKTIKRDVKKIRSAT